MSATLLSNQTCNERNFDMDVSDAAVVCAVQSFMSVAAVIVFFGYAVAVNTGITFEPPNQAGDSTGRNRRTNEVTTHNRQLPRIPELPRARQRPSTPNVLETHL